MDPRGRKGVDGMIKADSPIVYLCDPEKNKKCLKTVCQSKCLYTFHPEFSKDGKRYIYNYASKKYEDLDN